TNTGGTSNLTRLCRDPSTAARRRRGPSVGMTGNHCYYCSATGDWLEDAAELEEPFVVAGIANDAGGEPGHGVGIAINLAKFTRAREIDLSADERREREDLVEIAATREEILVAKQLVQAIGAQLVGSAEKEGWR